MKEKPCSASLTVKTFYVMPPDTNTYGTLFGGNLMAAIDDAAAIAAMRHARKPVVTASTDSVDFLSPIREGNSVCVEAFVTWTGRTSMEVFVKVVAEDLLTGERQVSSTAFLTFVAVDEDGQPVEVPSVYPETSQEKVLHEEASGRARHREQRRRRSRDIARNFGTDFPWDHARH